MKTGRFGAVDNLEAESDRSVDDTTFYRNVIARRASGFAGCSRPQQSGQVEIGAVGITVAGAWHVAPHVLY